MMRPYLVIFVLISIAVYCYSETHSGDVTVHHANVEPAATTKEIKPIDGVARKFGESAEIRCVPTAPGAEVYFYRNDELIERDDKRYIFNPENSSITIKHVGYDDIGVYQCSENDEQRVNVTLYSIPYVRDEKSVNTSPDYNVTLDCKAKGLPLPVVTWYGYNTTTGVNQLISSDDKRVLILNSTITNGQLKITKLTYDDYKLYTCVASNRYGSHNGTTLVRVKSQWRAIWPIIGIIIQLAILALIIFFYERRKKQEMEIEKKLEAEFNKSHPVDGDRSEGLRQRKST